MAKKSTFNDASSDWCHVLALLGDNECLEFVKVQPLTRDIVLSFRILRQINDCLEVNPVDAECLSRWRQLCKWLIDDIKGSGILVGLLQDIFDEMTEVIVDGMTSVEVWMTYKEAFESCTEDLPF